ncbi:hypothetical protein G7077_06015 [Sphingomonas piscis]|uniref:Glycosyltransferase RgtA/B/C/D-like domain-containing protein n=1 Tax=Sphingomonas piscis TaxID=2714943 RepID=A0A6G7YP52_9SPHN|nr:hypothetical protein [Sphingomonas piscis]QIK78520.1 hypothetical protein G7077_06015 [Sphingomonas piscis]
MEQPQSHQAEEGSRRAWWEERWFVALLVLLSAVPLLYPTVPPLVDLPGHMGRYRVQLDVDSSPWLWRYYGFHWAPIGNLGVDLLIWPLGKLMGLEPAVKLVVLAIPPLTVAGFLWVAREVHGRLPPTALFALPFAYAHPFMYGFVNYALSIALAFLAFGLWLRLGRINRTQLRAILFVPISVIVFFTHTYGWGVLGLLCFSAEAVRQHDRGGGWFRSVFWAGLQASTMALPVLIMAAWRGETHGGMIRGWFEWGKKWEYVIQALRDRWEWFDQGSLLIVAALLMVALFHRKLSFSRNLLFSAFVLLVGYVLIPRTIFGSTYADMRLVPFVIAVALLSIRFREPGQSQLARTVAVAGLAFVLVRFGAHTASLGMAAADQNAKLEALNHVPMGARVASMIGQKQCNLAWEMPRNSHLGGMVIVRKHGFSNDQWAIQGQNLLDLRYHSPGVFRADPSEMVRAMHCRRRTAWRVDLAFRMLPHDKLDYLWLIDPPPINPAWTKDMTEVWRGPHSVLYRLHP